MMKPIPRSLLIHTAAVVAEKTDRWGEISETSTETLKICPYRTNRELYQR